MASMARQIRLLPQEIDLLSSMVEWAMIHEVESRKDLFDSLSWAVRAARSQGPKPERKDFDPRLPDPEEDYQRAVAYWEGNRQYVRDLVKDIRDSRTKWRELRRLHTKLWYYGD